MLEGIREMQNLFTRSNERIGFVGDEEYRRIEYSAGRHLQTSELMNRVKEEEAARLMFMLNH
ncbi:hypothetical protein DCC85_19760 [Paenibacillus sp. CAA11]|uniref:hypothetical protein n=1 Tax=Paenibacillus sp. CAA11 TaxID=1532905 RepID=UPI000D381EC8|nr:hypothetical protein [Paenibacillus sp. CAA11]AWB46175.1 hypothetical protein DCC85_19760 [Paenibacillus sp. CAA11]